VTTIYIACRYRLKN